MNKPVWAAVWAGWSAMAAACPIEDAAALRDGPLALTWATPAAPLRVGQHFSMTVHACPAQAELSKVDAHMPAHRHGMNYRPTIRALGDGRWQVDGMMLHMSGNWALQFELRHAGKLVTLQRSITLP